MSLFAARIISLIFHPYLLTPLGSYLVIYKYTGNSWISFQWTSVVVMFALLVLLFELIGIRIGLFSNLDIKKRSQRAPAYVFVLTLSAILSILTFVFNGPKILTVSAATLFIGLIVFLLVNRKIKASVHIGAISAFLAGLSLLYGGYFYLLIFLIPVAIWSRIKTKNHSFEEAIVGGILGMTFTIIGYAMLQYY